MSDKQLRQNILDELDYDPEVESDNIGVVVDNGVVTLTGHVRSYAERLAVEAAVKRIAGVEAIAEEIEVRYPEDKKVADDQIAKRALDIINWDAQLPRFTIQATVQNGWITLAGNVDWQYQKLSAEAAVRKLSGVRGVDNRIVVKGSAAAHDVRKRIEDALRRNAQLAARNIHINVANGKVTLKGKIGAWHERQLAERAAWSAPGVLEVDDQLSF
jgi:osmotically-inducible protein OsmY